jgi:antitoxin (DNA-binding transcriptional repressor) of toxin-antitoxin stability system
MATCPEGSPSRPPALPAPKRAKRLYGERACGIEPNSREAAPLKRGVAGGVAPLGWVTEDRVLCGLKSGKGLLPPAPVCYHVYTIRAAPMQTQKVGIREFRERLATFLEASGPVAITRHGETVGYYIPARPSKDAAHVAALRTAAAQLDALLAASGATEDELVNDFKEARRSRRKVRT